MMYFKILTWFQNLFLTFPFFFLLAAQFRVCARTCVFESLRRDKGIRQLFQGVEKQIQYRSTLHWLLKVHLKFVITSQNKISNAQLQACRRWGGHYQGRGFSIYTAEGKKESFGVCQGVIIILGHGILDGHWRPSMMGSMDSGSSEAKGLIPWASWSY